MKKTWRNQEGVTDSPVVVQDQLPHHVGQICRLGVLTVRTFLAGISAGAGEPQQVENVGRQVGMTHLQS